MNFNLGKLTNPSRAADAVAVIDCCDTDSPKTCTHGALDALADACARGLLRRGLRAGDRVGIMSLNRLEFLVAYLGAMRAGMTAVPINHKLAQDTLGFIVADCEAKLLFVDAERARQVPAGIDSVRLDDPQWDAFLDPGAFETVRPEAGACAMILYTSGSTGRPKGVQLSHEGQLWSLRARFVSRSNFENERFLVAAPLFHMNALTSCKFVLAAHASVVLLPQFDARQFIRAIDRYGVTWVTSVPTMMAMVVRQTDALASIDTSAVRYIRMGSAPATRQLHDAVQQTFPNAAIAGGYGTTEAGPIVFGPTGGRSLPPGGGLGWPLPDVEVRLVDAEGRDAEEGELWMRTPANMLGYLHLPEKTREVLTDDGWYKSGDILRRDAQGCHHFVGRADDMFNCGGENIYPAEVEQVIERMPQVMQACVVPVPDDLKGQKPVAFIVLRQGRTVSEAEVKSFVLAHAPAYQHPRRVHVLEALPLAATHKIDRRALKGIASGQTAAPAP